MERPLLGSRSKSHCLLRADKMVEDSFTFVLVFHILNYLRIISMMGANFVSDIYPEFIMIYTDLSLCNTKKYRLKLSEKY